MNNHYKEIERFLNNIDEIELLNKIKYFRSLNIKNMLNEEISNEILNVLCFNKTFHYIINIKKYLKGTNFFRIRKLNGKKIPNSNLQIESDFWNPPEEVIFSYGRLNKPHESLLYTSLSNPHICIDEMKIKKDEFFALIKYISKSEVKVNMIGGEYDYNTLGIKSKKAVLVHEIYNNFLKDEFSRDVGIGTEHLYKISEIIAKWYFDLPPRDVQDAWAYSSIPNKNNYNVCFRPEIAKDLLELQGAAICEIDEDSNIIPICITHGFDDKGIAQFYKLGSEVQRKYFPEINKKS